MGRRLADLPAPDPRRGRSVECNRSEHRKIVEQMLELVVLCLADRLVETAAPARRSDDIPQADAALAQPIEPPLIIERLKVFADRRTEQPPELVGGMRIVTPRRERCVSRQAAEDEQGCIGACDWRKAEFDAHG